LILINSVRVCVGAGVVIVVSMGVVFGLLIGASMLGVAVCLLRWYVQQDVATT